MLTLRERLAFNDEDEFEVFRVGVRLNWPALRKYTYFSATVAHPEAP